MADISISNILQTGFLDALTVVLNNEAPEFEFIKSVPVKIPNARTVKHLIGTSLNPASIGPAPSGSATQFLPLRQPSVSEADIKLKRCVATVGVESEVYRRAKMGDYKYVEDVLQYNMDQSMSSLARWKSKLVYGDGSGVLAVVATGGLTETGLSSTGIISVVCAEAYGTRGYIGWIEVGDEIVFAAANGTFRTPGTPSATFYAYIVTAVDLSTYTITAKAITSAGATVTASGGSQIANADCIYKAAQYHLHGSLPNLSSISDYDTFTDNIIGLRGLIQTSGTYAGLDLSSSVLQGNVVSGGGNLIGPDDLMTCLNQVSKRVGRNRFNFKDAWCSYETAQALFEGREANRQFGPEPVDSAGGGNGWVYTYYSNKIVINPMEFCPRTDLFMIPTLRGAEGEDSRVLMHHATEMFETMPDGGMVLAPGTWNYKSELLKFFEGYDALATAFPAALVRLVNFTNS